MPGVSAWTWHTSPRAVCHAGRTYWGVVERTAEGLSGIVVCAYEHASGKIEKSPVLLTVGSADDHCNPSVWVRPDGRVVMGAAGHTSDRLWYAVSAEPGSVAGWGRVLAVKPGRYQRYSYTQMVFLADEGAEGRLYWFFRGRGYSNPVQHKFTRLLGYANCWAFATSDDWGESWSDATMLWRERGVKVPYTHVVSDGRDTIYLTRSDAMDGADEADRRHVMACRIQAGEVTRLDGARICTVSRLPISRGDALERVYDSDAPEGRPAFNLDLVLDEGDPVVAFSTLVRGDQAAPQNLYHVARWKRGRWAVEDVAAGGPSIYASAGHPHYSGGMTLDPADADRVLLGVVDDSGPGKTCEVQEWRKDSVAGDWRFTRSLRGCGDAMSLRPFCPRGERGPVDALWLAGEYLDYKHWDTGMRLGVRG